MTINMGKAVLASIGAALALLGVYFGVLGLLSGWNATVEQFLTYRYFVLALAAGFGVQVGLFVRRAPLRLNCASSERASLRRAVSAGN